MMGRLRSNPELEEKPRVITYEINEWFRFDMPGKYRLYLTIHRDNLSGGRIGPEFEVLLDYNLVSHCWSRLYRDAALVRLVTVFQRCDELFLLSYRRCANEKSLERGSA